MGGGGVGTRPWYSGVCLWQCLSPLLILTLCGSERVLVVSMEPPDERGGGDKVSGDATARGVNLYPDMVAVC